MATNQDFDDLIQRIETATETLESDVALVGDATQDMQQAVEDAQGYAQNAAQSVLEAQQAVSDAEGQAQAAANSAQQAENTIPIIEGMITDLENAVIIDEAPKDGKEYARKDGDWVEVVGGGGGSVDWDDVTNKPSFGTAAEADLTTAVLDTTPGRVLVSGWGNLGSEALANSMTNEDNNNRNRFLLTRAYNQANRPSWIGAVAHGVLTLPINNDQGLQLTYSPTSSHNKVSIRTYRSGEFQPWTDLVTQEGLATVATTGAYSDLTGKPTLGTAASANVTTTVDDTTAGRVLTVGYGGLNVPTIVTDFSAIALGQNRNNLFRTPFGPTDRPVTANYFSGIAFGHNLAGYEAMLTFGAGDGDVTGAMHIRNKVAGTWQSWRRVLDSRSLVEDNEDTTATRIPTVGWVQANAGKGDPGVVAGGTAAEYAAQTFIYDVATMENRAADVNDTVFGDAVDVLNNFGRRFPVCFTNCNDATNGPTPWYDDGINPLATTWGTMEIVPTFGNASMTSVTFIWVYATIHTRSTIAYGKRYMRRMRPSGAWYDANWKLIPAELD